MRCIHGMLFLGFLILTLNVYGQSKQSQETIDALQEQKIAQIEAIVRSNTESIRALTVESVAMRSSLDRFTGMGIGIGAAITTLQAILVIVTFKNKK